jgi:beta-lactamase class A
MIALRPLALALFVPLGPIGTSVMGLQAPGAARGASGDRAPEAAAAFALESRLIPLIEEHKGQVAVAVKHLDSGESFTYRADVPMPTASLIKFPVMVETYRQAEKGQVSLDTMLTLKQEDKVQGSGILTNHFSEGSTLRLRDAVRLMIAFSDNTATNLVLDQIGLGSTAATMEAMGYPNTKIHAKVYRRDTSIFPERSKEFGLGSTTAADMVDLLERLHHRTLISPEASDAMLEHLRACDDRDKFPRFLPHGTKIAFKTGSVDQVRTAAGIIETPSGPVALCVLTCKNEDQRWVPDNAGNRLCAEIAREVYEHFAAPQPAANAASITPETR